MRLATKEDFKKLDECYTRFDKELKGRWFFDEETGEKLFLPCEGYCSNTMVNDVGSLGSYWSSTQCGSGNAYFFSFDSNYVFPGNNYDCGNGRSVRLVSDEPFEGAVHVAGLYWKPTNEYGYYTWYEAMAKFIDKN